MSVYVIGLCHLRRVGDLFILAATGIFRLPALKITLCRPDRHVDLDEAGAVCRGFHGSGRRLDWRGPYDFPFICACVYVYSRRRLLGNSVFARTQALLFGHHDLSSRFCCCCWSLLYSDILRSRADSLRSHVILHS